MVPSSVPSLVKPGRDEFGQKFTRRPQVNLIKPISILRPVKVDQDRFCPPGARHIDKTGRRVDVTRRTNHDKHIARFNRIVDLVHAKRHLPKPNDVRPHLCWFSTAPAHEVTVHEVVFLHAAFNLAS